MTIGVIFMQKEILQQNLMEVIRVVGKVFIIKKDKSLLYNKIKQIVSRL